MHVIGVEFADVAVAVGGEGQLVVLRAVDDLGLEGGVYLAEAHGGGGAAQQAHHGDVGGGLLDADLQALQIGGGLDGGIHGVEVPGTRVDPGHSLEASLLGGFKDWPGNGWVVHGVVVRFAGDKEIRQIKKGVVFGKGLQNGVAGYTEVNGSGLGQLDHVRLRPQQLAGIDLHIILVAQLAFDVLLEGKKRYVCGVVCGLVVPDADDSLIAP